jgi:hypothetical protein
LQYCWLLRCVATCCFNLRMEAADQLGLKIKLSKYIWELLCSNLGRNICNSLVPSGKFRDSTQIRARPLPSNFITDHLTIRRHNSVGLLGWEISPPQGCYIHTVHHKHIIYTDEHLYLEGDSNPRSPAFEQTKRVHASDRAATLTGSDTFVFSDIIRVL